MIRRYFAQRFRTVQLLYSGRFVAKPVGTIPLGTILYIQDQVRPLRPLGSRLRREPGMVEAWLPRGYAGVSILRQTLVCSENPCDSACYREHSRRFRRRFITGFIRVHPASLTCLASMGPRTCSPGAKSDTPKPVKMRKTWI